MCFWIPLCFPAQSRVVVQGKGSVCMDSLQIGDEVESFLPETGALGTSRVIGWLHREVDTVGEYLVLHYASSKKKGSLSLSADHMVFVQGPDEKVSPVPASSVGVGDVLFLAENGRRFEGKVESIETIHFKGVYAPLTDSGCIVVDGVVASCYVWTEYSHKMAHKAFAPIRWMDKKLPTGINPANHKFGNVHWYAKALSALA